MIKGFKAYIKTEKLFDSGDKILLAVSGGVDSVAMVYLFRKAGYQFAIAHSNFALRGRESDADEAFVQRLAATIEVPFYSRRFDTTAYAAQKKVSIQMAARELRYTWFDELLDIHGYAYVATAHHLDDQAETFFINLIRGTGISGLHGILPKQGRVVRPMLFTTRDRILKCAVKEKLQWREDRSNSSRKYLRNKLRLDVLPEIIKIKQNFSFALNDTIKRLREAEQIYNSHLAEVSADLIQHTPEGDLISIDWLYEYVPHHTYLFELLKPYNFAFPVVEQIVHSLDTFSGKVFYSPTHRLLRDRENFIIQPLAELLKTEVAEGPFVIDRNVTNVDLPVKLILNETSDIAGLTLGRSDVACFDAQKLTFPLTLRRWQKGDWFIPFGNKGKKKLSDFFIDQKLSLAEKNQVWLLTSGNDIVWVVGRRIDNRFCITPKTQQALVICLKANNTQPEQGCCNNSLFFC